MTVRMDQLSILLVDDDPFSLELTSMGLQKIGYRNTVASKNGKCALQKLTVDDAEYELIILDLNMPEMDGAQFMRHLNDIEFDGGIILLSGEDKRILETAFSLAKTYKLNILGTIPKPLSPTILSNMLNSYEPVPKVGHGYLSQHPISVKDLRSGIMGSLENQLELVYQPKISVRTGQIASVESLARWRSAERGILGPAAFIPLAEETGLIDALSFQIYQKAIIQTTDWIHNGINLMAAVNFSVNSFSKPGFCKSLVSITEQHKVISNRIILELTESQTMTIASDCLEALMGMRLKRFNLSIDDFGTGNSTMTQLKSIPFTELKIDREFVTGASTDDSALAILETSIDLARKLNMQIVAEGAETKEDWDLVEELGCDYVQGFYCAKPMNNEEFVGFLHNWNGPH